MYVRRNRGDAREGKEQKKRAEYIIEWSIMKLQYDCYLTAYKTEIKMITIQIKWCDRF